MSADHSAVVWDNAATPVLEVESGETVELEAADASGGQLNAQSTTEDVTSLDLGKVNPITGPVYVNGAEPGHVLAVEIRRLKAHHWGWTAIIPGFGLLADEFPDPWLNISTVDEATRKVQFADDIALGFSPFPGTIGLAPEEPGQHSVVPPSKWGGNMDIKHLRVGTTLFLPVAVPGALFSVGDTHAAMGDGEVCGTAVETAMDIAVRLTVRKDISARYPQYHVPQGQLAEQEQSSYHVCTGIHNDLFEATREAIRATIDYIAERYGRSRQEAYAIASVAVDLRIHEVVDVPNWVVGAFLPEAIFG
ncbi:MAG TPA: acetamidase/formamidase family protein [Solirubrobacteraceae bacterium]